MNKIAKNYIMNLIYELVAILVPLCTAPYLTRVLHSDNYGIYGYVQSVTAIIGSLTMLGIYSYGNRQTAYCRDNPQELSNTFWELMTLRGILGIIGTLVFVGVALRSEYSFYFLIYYASYLATIIDCSWIYVGIENMLPCVLKNIVAKLLSFIGIFVLVRSEADLGKYFALVAICAFVTNVSVYTQLKGIIKKPSISWKNVWKHLKGSVWLFLPQIACLLYLQMDKVMIGKMAGAINQVSFYDQADKIVTITLSCISAISTVMMPRIANEYQKGHADQITYYVNNALKISIALAAPMTIGLACTAMQLIPWYLGEEYVATAYAIIVISPITISSALMGVSGRLYFVATNKIGIITFSNAMAAGVNLLVNALMIPRYGYMGAAIATLVASYTNVIIQFIALNKFIKIKEVFRGSYRYLLISVLMGGIVFGETYLLGLKATALSTIIQVFTGIAFYGGILLLLKDDVAMFALATLKGILQKYKGRDK